MKILKKRSFISDLMFGFIGLMIIVVTCISAVFYHQLVLQNKKQILEKFDQSFFQAHISMEENLEGMISTAATLSTNSELAIMVKRSRTLVGKQAQKMYNTIRNTIVNAANLNSDVSDVAIYGQDALYRYNASRFAVTYQNKIPKELWFQDLQNGKISHILVPEYAVGEDISLCLYACTFPSMSKSSLHDVIVVTLDNSILNNIVKNIDKSYSATVCLLGSNGNLLYSNQPETAAHFVEEGVDFSALQIGQECTIAEQDYYITKSSSSYTGWHLIAFANASNLREAFYSVPLSLICGYLFAITACAILSIWFFHVISKSLREIVTAIDETISHNFETVTINSPYEEIQTIAYAFNHLNHDLVHYIEELKRVEKEKRITELKLLETQINPHFIYNTLDSVKWMAIINNDPTVANMVSSFSRLLQISLSSGKERLTVELEFEHVRHYVNIMQIRYNSEIDVTFEATPEVLALYTMKFVIQPFVENCFLHAFESGENRHKFVRVRAQADSNALTIEISDNGKGLNTVTALDEHRMRSGIGIKNIDSRIKLYYGPEYGVDIFSQPGQGTTIQIRQPLIKTQEEPNHD